MQYIKLVIISVLGIVFCAPQIAMANEAIPSAYQYQNIPIVTVRKGEHLNYSRLVFDFSNSVVYQTSRADNKLTVIFDVAFIPEFGKLIPEPLKWISNPQVSQADGLMAITFDVYDDSELIHSYIGEKVVLDIYDPTADKGGVENDNAQRIRAGNVIQSDEPPIDQSEPAVTDLTVTPTYEEIDNGIMITYPTKLPTATAVFERGGIMWLVFETLVPFDHGNYDAINSFVKDRIRSVEINVFESATIIHYTIKQGQSIGVERHGLDWKISLKDTASAPKNPLTPIKQMVGDDDFRIFVPAADIGTRLELIDPLVGDSLSIIPLRSSSRGLPAQRQYSDFILPVTAQGLVVQRISDQLAVYRYRNGIAIGGRNTNDQGLPNGGVSGAEELLVDFSSWSRGDAGNFRALEEALLYRVASTNTERRNAARWDLARFYLAHNRAAEASGILEHMLDDDSQLSGRPSFRAARGVAYTKLGHYDIAIQDFEMRELNSDQDIALWRAHIYQLQGRNVDAVANFERGRDAIGRYSALERGDFILSSARANYELEKVDKAEFDLDQLAGHLLTQRQMSEMELLRAEIALVRGQGEVAMANLNSLSRLRDQSISSRARYARLKYKMAAGAIVMEDAIDEMERLRYVWRGDDFELNLLRELSDIYIANNNYRDGLDVMRQVVSYFSKTDEAMETSNHMTDVFKDLYLNCKADVLDPFDALGLYTAYKELTPFGAEGDRMIRRVADRLVAVDLFDPAIEFLDYQIRDRIEGGVARAQIAANLAKIYLLDSRPVDALQILRATRAPNLPRDLEIGRNLIEARALYEDEKYEEAEVLIIPITNIKADQIRADIYWRMTDWDRVVEINNKMLGNGWQEKEKLGIDKRLMLLRLAIAHTFVNDTSNLAILRGRYLEQIMDGDLAASFDLLTNPDGLSSRDIATVISEIDDVSNVDSYLQQYRDDFVTSDCEPLFERTFDEEQRVLGAES